MKPIFCGNLEYDARPSELERLFRRYGKVDRVDVKSGFAFVYMEDERDAEEAIRRLDRTEFGRKGRRLRVEWTKQERGIRRPDSSKRSANTKPTKTLFVINFDPVHTRERDLERHFDPHGKVLNIRIRRNFAFIQFASEEDSTRALEATNMSKFLDRVISVEYAIRDDDDRRNGHSPERRGRDFSPDKRRYSQGRSPSPYRRDRDSPDYGHGSKPNSRLERRGSPDYDRAESPAHERYQSRSPPPRESRRSPLPRERSRSPLPRERNRSPPPRERSLSPPPRERNRSPPPRERNRSPPPRERSLSPLPQERSLSPLPRDLSRS